MESWISRFLELYWLAVKLHIISHFRSVRISFLHLPQRIFYLLFWNNFRFTQKSSKEPAAHFQNEFCFEKKTLEIFSLSYLYHCACVLVAQSYPTLYAPMDYSPPDSSVCGMLQARILEWVAIPCTRGSCQPRDRSWISHIAGRFFTI